MSRTSPDGVFETTDLHHLFPTLIWKLRLGKQPRSSIADSLRARISRQMSSDHSLSHGQRWQSANDLHQDTELEPLMEAIRHAAGGALTQLHVNRKHLSITGSWVGVHARGAQQTQITHPNNYLAGLYWVQAPPGADSVHFHDPRPQTGLLRPTITRASRENALQSAIRVEAGTLLLFPAWLAYSLAGNESFESRIFVGFTLMFDQFADRR